MRAYYIVLISVIIFAVLAIFAMRFPRSRQDWKKDRAETLSLLTSIIVFLFLFLMLWYIVSVITWPSTMDMLIWASAIVFLILLVAAIFVPRGLRIDWGRKKDKTKTADDE